SSGQLGNGTQSAQPRLTPLQIGAATNWAEVAAGFQNYHTFAVKTDGTLWAWGENDDGALGDGTVTTLTAPVRIGSASDWTAVVANGGCALAAKISGAIWAWGDNSHGQIGDGIGARRFAPLRIGTTTNWMAMAANSGELGYLGHTLAIRADGTLWG